jgi:hypothetical protein
MAQARQLLEAVNCDQVLDSRADAHERNISERALQARQGQRLKRLYNFLPDAPLGAERPFNGCVRIVGLRISREPSTRPTACGTDSNYEPDIPVLVPSRRRHDAIGRTFVRRRTDSARTLNYGAKAPYRGALTPSRLTLSGAQNGHQ